MFYASGNFQGEVVVVVAGVFVTVTILDWVVYTLRGGKVVLAKEDNIVILMPLS